MVLLLLISFACPVFALSSSDENTISGVELSIKRTKSKILGQSKTELANEILAELGLEDSLIEKLAEERKIEVADAYEINRTDEYGKVYSDGSILPISKVEFDDYEIKNTENNIQKAQTPPEAYEYIEEDGTFHKQLYVIRTKNAPQGTYGIITAYQWKTMSTWRGTDILSVSGENLIFDKSSFRIAVEYIINHITNFDSYVEYGGGYYTPSDLENPNDLQGFKNAIAFKYNLPNDINLNTDVSTYMINNLNLTFMIVVSTRIANPDQRTVFNVYSNYFHQKLGIGSLGVSISATGASVSVSPKTFYKMYQIMTSKPIEYNP